jgi:hypothetical protein
MSGPAHGLAKFTDYLEDKSHKPQGHEFRKLGISLVSVPRLKLTTDIGYILSCLSR